jgi:hypothetical protein
MRVKKPVPENYGQPTGGVRVLITQRLHGKGACGKSAAFTVYDTDPWELKNFLLDVLSIAETHGDRLNHDCHAICAFERAKRHTQQAMDKLRAVQKEHKIGGE